MGIARLHDPKCIVYVNASITDWTPYEFCLVIEHEFGHLRGLGHATSGVMVIASGQFLPALKRLWLRSWQMYVAHILLFLTFTAQIARTARKWDNPMYKDEFNVANFLAHPDELIGKALTLQYKPVDLDVLPLYITLVVAAPFVVWLHDAPAQPDPGRFGRALHSGALFRLEPAVLPERDKLVFQSVLLAIDVLLRLLVRHRRRRPAQGSS